MLEQQTLVTLPQHIPIHLDTEEEVFFKWFLSWILVSKGETRATFLASGLNTVIIMLEMVMFNPRNLVHVQC